MYLHRRAGLILKDGKAFSLLANTKIFEKVIKIKYDVPNDKLDMMDDYYKIIDDSLNSIR
jgi:V/A-type H+-transporting ATPase subunit A